MINCSSQVTKLLSAKRQPSSRQSTNQKHNILNEMVYLENVNRCGQRQKNVSKKPDVKSSLKVYRDNELVQLNADQMERIMNVSNISISTHSIKIEKYNGSFVDYLLDELFGDLVGYAHKMKQTFDHKLVVFLVMSLCIGIDLYRQYV
eukprot:221256_1